MVPSVEHCGTWNNLLQELNHISVQDTTSVQETRVVVSHYYCYYFGDSDQDILDVSE